MPLVKNNSVKVLPYVKLKSNFLSFSITGQLVLVLSPGAIV